MAVSPKPKDDAQEIPIRIYNDGLEDGNRDVAEALDGIKFAEPEGLLAILRIALAECVRDQVVDDEDGWRGSENWTKEAVENNERATKILAAHKRLQDELNVVAS